MKLAAPIAAATLLIVAAACSVAPPAAPPFAWQLPPGFPLPLTRAENLQTAAKFELGRELFYDRRLSANGTQSCADCHQQQHAFTDGRTTAIGSTGEHHTRNAMTLANAAYNPSYTWDDTRLQTLEQQALVPMFNTHPIELGVRGNDRAIESRLRKDAATAAHFREAFPNERHPVSIRNAAKAIAAFEGALISGRSPYDRFVYAADSAALSAEATRGMRLFFSARAGCAECHSGFNFAGESRYVGRPKTKPQLVSNGITAGKFRVPTLRNIELTAPYMHDGSIATLEEVIARYVAARKLPLSIDEQADLAAFLRSLTDREFVTNARFAAPK